MTDASAPSRPKTVLHANHLVAGYGRVPVIEDVTVHAVYGEIVLLLGHNGAGKSTVLKSVLGLAKVFGGDVEFRESSLGGEAASRIRGGIGYVPQALGVFPRFSVRHCLELGGYTLGRKQLIRKRITEVLDLLPAIADKGDVPAGLLSGGEQRLLTVGMALMARPHLLLVDEPSAGLAPSRVPEIMGHLRKLTAIEPYPAIILVEQNVEAGLSIGDRAYILRQGRVVGEFRTVDLRQRESFWDLL